MLRSFLALIIFVFGLVAAGCSSGPQPPQPGTAAFYFASAKSTYAAGDFLKVTDNLSQLHSSADYGARTRAWSIVMSAGLAKGYMDMADNFEYGARANRANSGSFHRQLQQLRSMAGAAAMQCAESTHKFVDENKSDPVTLEFGYPRGNFPEPVQLQRVAKGMMLPPPQVDELTNTMMQRGVLITVTRVVGADDDPAKTQEVFKAAEVKVPRAVFLQAVAKALVEQADLYTPSKLDQPNRITMLCDQADEALKSVPESKATKDLAAKIAKLRKPGKRA
jgi:hypothetical protein